MCGRFDFSWDEEVPAVRRMLELTRERFPDAEPPRGEICPGTVFPLLVRGAQGPEPALARWGLAGPKGLVINARAETAAVRPLFRDCLRDRRGAALATGFYEWSHDGRKLRYRFRLPDRAGLYLAALYDEAGRYVILTEPANASVAPVHDRMPVILGGGELRAWLTDPAAAAFFLTRPGPALEREPAG